ncbi:MAG: hypothetical protein ABWY81_03935 [Jiangellaceae bacterium]
MTGTGSTRQRWVAFALVAVVILAVGVVYLLNAVREQAEVQATPAEDVRNDQSEVLAQPHIVFVSTQVDDSYGRVAAAPLDDPGGARVVTDTECERVTSDGELGVCLSADRGVMTKYRAHVLGPDLQPGKELSINGDGSRTRIADDGRLAATTTFVTGHSYNQAGFSTETLVHDLATGESVNLEEFVTILDGKASTAIDRNVWGVTFAEGDTFFASVATGGSTWLVRGDLSARELRSLRTDAECPSLSPDGTRIAYKKRAGGGSWRLHVLDLASGEERAVDESRSVDDQVEWLDDTSLLYAIPRAESATTDVWVVSADGGEPQVLIPGASSPAVVR